MRWDKTSRRRRHPRWWSSTRTSGSECSARIVWRRSRASSSSACPAELIATLETAAVYEEQGALLFPPVGQGAQLMLALSDADFVLPSVDATLRFSLADEEASAKSVTIEQGGLTLLFER